MKRAVYALFFFLLIFSGCCTKNVAWQFDSFCERTCNGFKKIRYVDANICKNLEVDFILSSEGLRMYISILSIPLRSSPGAPQTTECKLHYGDGAEDTIQLSRLEGGQRFLVPDDAMHTVIDRLWAGDSVVIKLGRYEGILVSDNFRAVYQELLNKSSCSVKVHWSSFSLR
ncbi:hypothetical protein [Estrella lausannensis]|uniref:Putative secreted protein n=1 Tax=Estrella lausannensis TaxID=483423 RepID=A0A0H5DQX4_9BACT|nr:hypothetical protein [Estrella lausannensis]CRX38014.1 putative secreted protein [Estrella lausannensis]